MTNQSPAEALRQPLFQILQRHKVANVATDTTLVDAFMDDILELVTAYAATVEREAVEDTIWKIMSPKTEGLFDGGDLFIKRKPIEDAIIGMIGYEKYKALQEAVDDRLAALQGPIQGDAPDHSEVSGP